MGDCYGLYCAESNFESCKTNYSFNPGWNSFVSFHNYNFITNFLSSILFYTLFSTQSQSFITNCTNNYNISCFHSFEITNSSNIFGIPIKASINVNNMIMSRMPFENDIITSKTTIDHQFLLFQNNTWKNMTHTGVYLFGETMYEYHTDQPLEIIFNLCSERFQPPIPPLLPPSSPPVV